MYGFGQELQAAPSGGSLRMTRTIPMTATSVVSQSQLSKKVEFARAALRNQANIELSKQPRDRMCKNATTTGQCMDGLVRHDMSDFRVGMRHVFEGLKISGNKAVADQLVPLIGSMITAETQMAPVEAHFYVLRDYMPIFKTVPAVTQPSRNGRLITGAITPTPLPSTGPSNGTMFRMPGGADPGAGPVIQSEEEDIEFAPVDVNGEKPPYLLYAGVAAVVLLGIGYVATRPKSTTP